MLLLTLLVVATTGAASAGIQVDNTNIQSSSGGLGSSALIGIVIGVFLLVILIGGISVVACKMTGKFHTKTSGRKHRTDTREDADPESLGLDLELEPPALEAKPSYVSQGTEEHPGPLAIPLASLDYGEEIKDTGRGAILQAEHVAVFGRTYKGTWQGRTVLIKRLHTESLNDEQLKSAISEVALLM